MQTFFSDILHVISQALLIPDIVLLVALIAYALFSIGSILVEWATEHRRYKVKMPQLLDALTNAAMATVPSVIEESGLLRRQREALKTVYEYRNLPGDALIALVRRIMNQEEAHYASITNRNNMAARVAPMLGLVGTLIPLGPGIQALGQADTAMLSSSLLVAFDTTVAGLVAAAVCLVIGKIRSSWYDNYLSALDSAMATLVQKIEDSRPGAHHSTTAPAPGQPGAPNYDVYAEYSAYEASGGHGFVFDESLHSMSVPMPMQPPHAMPMAAPLPSDLPMATPVHHGAGETTSSGMPLHPDYSSIDGHGHGGVFEPTKHPDSSDPHSGR